MGKKGKRVMYNTKVSIRKMIESLRREVSWRETGKNEIGSRKASREPDSEVQSYTCLRPKNPLPQ